MSTPEQRRSYNTIKEMDPDPSLTSHYMASWAQNHNHTTDLKQSVLEKALQQEEKPNKPSPETLYRYRSLSKQYK